MVHFCGSFVWFTSVVHFSGSFVRFIRVVHSCGLSRGLFVWPVCAVHFSGVERTREGSSVLKLSHAGVEETRRGSKATAPVPTKRAGGRRLPCRCRDPSAPLSFPLPLSASVFSSLDPSQLPPMSSKFSSVSCTSPPSSFCFLLPLSARLCPLRGLGSESERPDTSWR